MNVDPSWSEEPQLDELLAQWRHQAPPIDLPGLEGRLQALLAAEPLGSTAGTPLAGAHAAAQGAGISPWLLGAGGAAVVAAAVVGWMLVGNRVEQPSPAGVGVAAADVVQANPPQRPGAGQAAAVPSLAWDELPELRRPSEAAGLRPVGASGARGAADVGGVAEPPGPAAVTLEASPEAPRAAERLDLSSAPDPAVGADAAAELRQLMQIRRVIAADPARGLKLAEEGHRTFARGALREEREALAVTALAQLGRTAEARARAARFLEIYPRSGFSGKMRAVLQE